MRSTGYHDFCGLGGLAGKNPEKLRRWQDRAAWRPRCLPALLLLAAGLGFSGCATPPVQGPPAYPPLALAAGERILVLAPHPDDEALACAGVIQQALAMRLPVQVVFLTYGDNNELSFLMSRKYPVLAPREVRAMGEMRHGEALQAGAALGLAPEQLVFLGYPDFGTLHLWLAYWQSRQPFQSMLTRVTQVPYATAFRPGAPYRAEEILSDLTGLLRRFKPTRVFVSHPADRNPDHLALYLFAQVALWDLEKEMRPRLEPYLVHYERWPSPRGWNPEQALRPPEPLAPQAAWRIFPLDSAQVMKKRRAIEAHRSQCAYAESYLLSFARGNELFGAFPPVLPGELTEPEARKSGAPGAEQPAPDAPPAGESDDYTEVSWRCLRRENDQLVLVQRFSRPLMELVQASVFCYGYRADRPFAEMPKLQIKIGAKRYECYDRGRKLTPGVVTLKRQGRVVTARISLKTLGDPQRILMSAMTSREEIPMDFFAWRAIELRPAP